MSRLPLAALSPGADPAPLKLFRMVAHAESAYAPWLQRVFTTRVKIRR